MELLKIVCVAVFAYAIIEEVACQVLVRLDALCLISRELAMEAAFHDAMQETPFWLLYELHDSSASLNVVVDRLMKDQRCFNLD